MHKKLLIYIKPLRGILAFTIVLGMLGVIATIAQMTLLSGVVNAVFLSHKGLTQVLLPLALLPGVLILRASLLWGREVTAQRAAILLKGSLRERVFAHLLQLGPAWSAGERTGELAAVVNEGVERLDAFCSRYLPQLVLSIAAPLLIIVVVSLVDWFSAVLLLVTGPIIPLLMFLVGSYTEKRIQAQWATLSRMSAHFLDVMQGLTTLKLFGRSQAQQERIARISDRFRDKTLQVLRYAFLSGAVLEFMTMMAIGVIATTLGVRLLNHGISFSSAFLVLLLAPEFYRPLQELGVQRHAAMEGEAAAKRIFEILETPPPIEERAAPLTGDHKGPLHRSQPPSPLRTGKSIPTGAITIDISDLSYTYPGKGRYALDHVSLSLPAKTCTALVGRSGAGKSTLVNLLMRFMDATGGTISANGVSITTLSPDRWRQYVALVPQRPYLFYGTVRENIRLARPEANNNEVMQAAELAGVTAFIDELPLGFDTQVGEQGMQLSAGQAQRVAIARAILKNAPILILDEPTSSLDPCSEALIRQSLTSLMRDRTVLVIAHRYNTIAQADRVIMLEEGRVAEGGFSDTLMPGDGVYARLPGAGGHKGPHPALHHPRPYGLDEVGFCEGACKGARDEGTAAIRSPARATQGSPPLRKHDDAFKTGDPRVPAHSPPDCVPALRTTPAPTEPAGWKVAMKTFTRLLTFLLPFRWLIALAILLGSVMIASSMGLLGMAAYLIAASALSPLLVLLSIPIYLVRAMGIVRALSRYAERLVSHNATFRLLARLRVWAYSRIEPQAPAHLLAHRSGDMLARLVADIEELQNFYLRVVSPMVVALVVSLFTFGIFSVFSMGLAWVALAFLAAAGVGVPILTLSLSRGLGKQQVKARAELNTQIIDGLQGIRDVLALGRSHAQLEGVATCDRTLGQVQRRMARITGLQLALGDLLMNTAMWVLIMLAIPLVATQYIDGVYLGVIGLLILASFEAVQPLAPAFQGLGHALAAAGRVFAVADAPPPVIESAAPQAIPPDPGPRDDEHLPSRSGMHLAPSWRDKEWMRGGAGAWCLSQGPDDTAGGCEPRGSPPQEDRHQAPAPTPPLPLSLQDVGAPGFAVTSFRRQHSSSGSYGLAFEHVFFAYRPGEREVLSDISFDLSPGSRVAMVGPSGAGKSTLVRLALRFWDPQSGVIRLNGQDIRGYSLRDLRNLAGVVAQDTYIFNDTLRANLLLARSGASEAEIEAAVERAQLTEFVRQLPQGLNTWVGEQGLKLSGGERQRLAIARAFLKNAPILILDEASANLDPLTERALLDALDELARGRAALQITHRLLAMERMDEILVLDHGRVVERGTHVGLLAMEGLYRQLFDVQRGVVSFSGLYPDELWQPNGVIPVGTGGGCVEG